HYPTATDWGIGDARNSRSHAACPRHCSRSLGPSDCWQTHYRSEQAASLFARRIVGAMQEPSATIAPGSRLGNRSVNRPRVDLMERGEIYLVSLDPTVGHAQRRKPYYRIEPAGPLLLCLLAGTLRPSVCGTGCLG